MDGERGIPLEPPGSSPHVDREPDTSPVSSDTCIGSFALYSRGGSRGALNPHYTTHNFKSYSKSSNTQRLTTALPSRGSASGMGANSAAIRGRRRNRSLQPAASPAWPAFAMNPPASWKVRHCVRHAWSMPPARYARDMRRRA
jgi:hypothetical protein